MKTFYSLILLLLSVISHAAPGDDGGRDHDHGGRNCLDQSEVNDIFDRWVKIHTTNPFTAEYKALVDETVTDDVTLEDQTVNFFFFPGTTGPYSTNKTSLIFLQQASFNTSTTEGLTYTPTVPPPFNCDTITFRWLAKETVNKVVPTR
jgi:hypothetical protein